MLFLDTSILVDVERGSKTTKKILNDYASNFPVPFSISSIVAAELLSGAIKANNEITRLVEDLKKFVIIRPSLGSSIVYGFVKSQLESEGNPISQLDVLIAAEVIYHKSTLLTKDKHFLRIKGLNAIII